MHMAKFKCVEIFFSAPWGLLHYRVPGVKWPSYTIGCPHTCSEACFSHTCTCVAVMINSTSVNFLISTGDIVIVFAQELLNLLVAFFSFLVGYLLREQSLVKRKKVNLAEEFVEKSNAIFMTVLRLCFDTAITLASRMLQQSVKCCKERELKFWFFHIFYYLARFLKWQRRLLEEEAVAAYEGFQGFLLFQGK